MSDPGFDEYDDDDDLNDEDLIECGLGPDGYCSEAGTEQCDFCCPNSDSDLFIGSKAWRLKHGRLK